MGSGFAFRSEQSGVSQLNSWGAFSDVGSETVCGFTLASGGPTPDFSLSATPASQTVAAGGSATYTVTVTPSGGYSGTVALSVSGLPSGATASFNPTSISGGSGSSTLTVATGSGTPAGTSALTITGADSAASLSHTAAVSLSVSTPSACVQTTPAGSWQNTPFANQTGSFGVQFDATPSQVDMNGVMGLSDGAATGYTSLAAIARFNPTGDIDARNGGAYAAASTIPYQAGVSYHFRLVVDITTHTYSIFVTAPGGTEQTVGSGFAFRSEQSGVSQLNSWGAYSAVGSEEVCGFALT